MNQELLKEAVSALELKSIFLSNSSSYINKELGPDIDSIDFHEWYLDKPLDITFFHKKESEDNANKEENKQILRFSYRFGLRLYIESPEEDEFNDEEEDQIKPDVEIVADFNLDYWVIESIEQPSEEAVKEFMIHNVPYHAWAYWREYASNTTARLGIKPIFIPMRNHHK